jgi:putative oxidoreductase
MSNLDASPWRERALAVLRIAAGAMFVSAGTMKLFGFPGTPAGPMPPVEIMSLMGAAGILEAFGGLLIVLGLFTRPVAFILSGEMAVAYFHGHVVGQSIYPTENNGMAAALYCFVFFYMVFAGAGAWSIDSARHRRRGASV